MCGNYAHPSTHFKIQGVIELKHFKQLTLLASIILLASYNGFAQEAPSPLDKALAGVGGQEALENLSTLSIEATGTEWVLWESFSPDTPAREAGTFTVAINYDIAGDNLRLDYVRNFSGVPRAAEFSLIIAGDLGFIDGVDGRFGPPARNMSSDLWAAVRRQQMFLNPHLILRKVIADPALLTEGDDEFLDGVNHHRLVVEDEVFPITLYVNAETGQLTKVSTMEADHLTRDTELEFFYADWQPIDGGLLFPTEVKIAFGGHTVHERTRSSIEVNPALDSSLFEFPQGAAPVFDAALAMRGKLTHEYLQMFAGLGFPRDGFQVEVTATEIAEGVHHLTGGSHHSMLIEQENGIVIAEAPLHPERGEAIIEWVESQFPGKPITHVISSHHHADHSAGLRAFVAHGTTIVLHEAAQPLFEAVFQAPSTLLPDALENNPVAATIETVPAGGSYTIPDASRPVDVHSVENPHAEDFVVTHVPGGPLFVVDIFSPPGNAGAAMGLNNGIAPLDLDIAVIAGGHGGIATFEEFKALLPAEEEAGVTETEKVDNVFFMRLNAGLNMISTPLKPQTPFTARSFAEEIGATTVIKLDPNTQEFVGFTANAPDDGFGIEGGHGYIVNLLQARHVAFVGAAWTNEPPVSAAPTQTVNVPDGAWAFVVSGRIVGEGGAASPLRVTVRNTRTNVTATDVARSGYFAAAFADLSRQSVVEVGDRLEVTVIDSTGEIASETIPVTVTPETVRQAFVPITFTDIGKPHQSMLLQNYPNPFNPETWIPFQLREPAAVVIRIYDSAGNLMRTLDVGPRAAGFYQSRTRAAYWNGRNDIGEQVSSGVYFYHFIAGNYYAIKKMIILK